MNSRSVRFQLIRGNDAPKLQGPAPFECRLFHAFRNDAGRWEAYKRSASYFCREERRVCSGSAEGLQTGWRAKAKGAGIIAATLGVVLLAGIYGQSEKTREAAQSKAAKERAGREIARIRSKTPEKFKEEMIAVKLHAFFVAGKNPAVAAGFLKRNSEILEGLDGKLTVARVLAPELRYNYKVGDYGNLLLGLGDEECAGQNAARTYAMGLALAPSALAITFTRIVAELERNENIAGKNAKGNVIDRIAVLYHEEYQKKPQGAIDAISGAIKELGEGTGKLKDPELEELRAKILSAYTAFLAMQMGERQSIGRTRLAKEIWGEGGLPK